MRAKRVLIVVLMILPSFLGIWNSTLARGAGLNVIVENRNTSSGGESSQLVIGLNTTYAESYANLTGLITQVSGRILDTVMIRGEVVAVVVDIPHNYASILESEGEASGLISYVEPNMKFTTLAVPNDPFYNLQWGLPKIEADWAWNTTTGDPSILVGLIDTGIDYLHPDLAANYYVGGYDWVNHDADPMDDNGHGTHCAGILGAVLNNSGGIAGLAQVRILAEKGLDYNGTGYESDLANAIIHAVDQGAKILTNSWGADSESYLIHEAVRYAYDNGVLVLAAAGNEASDTKSYPAAYKEVVAVTATKDDDAPAWFASYGDWVEVAAPGVNIYSTFLGAAYAYKSGTSMSSPHAAGVGALIWSRFPNATRDWVRAQLRYSAEDLGYVGLDSRYGYGRINARRAVEQTAPEHDLLIFDWEKPRNIQPGDTAVFDFSVLNFGLNNEQNVIAQLFVDGQLQTAVQLGDLPTGGLKTTSLSWAAYVEGAFNVTLYVMRVAGETVIDNNVMTRIISVRTMLTLNPINGPAGTTVTATGVDFEPQTELMVTFNDVFMGFAVTDDTGSFTFTFNVPLASEGLQHVKTQDSESNYVSSTFKVIDITPLDVTVDVGTLHFIGETAEFYTQVSFKGEAVNASSASAMLYKPGGNTEALDVEQVATGLYRSSYTITGNETGTYTLVSTASYDEYTVESKGTSFKSFLVSDTLALMNRQVLTVRDDIATVQTELGSIKLNLTAMNATLENIFRSVLTIDGNVGVLQTTLGLMNATIVSIEDGVATILVPGLGELKEDVSNLVKSQQDWRIATYIIIVLALIAAVSAAVAVILLGRKKIAKVETTPQQSPLV